MGERKVVSKYLPPDFDPSKVPRAKKSKDGLVSVRMMLPFSIQCTNCQTFMYQGRKFNSKKENVEGPEGKYLGIQRFRFYIKCTACSRPISFLTDPKNADYEMESGATRNYELKKDQEQVEEEALRDQEEEEKEAPLKALENRVLASQREMQEMDQLEEIKAMNMRHVQLLLQNKDLTLDEQTRALLEAREANLLSAAGAEQNLLESGLTEGEEALVKSIQFGVKQTPIQRLDEEDERLSEERRKQQALMFEKQQEELAMKPKAKPMAIPTIKVKRKRAPVPSDESAKKPKAEAKKEAPPPPAAAAPPAAGLGGLLGGYGSSSDSD